jgi:hypothetical protein
LLKWPALVFTQTGILNCIVEPALILFLSAGNKLFIVYELKRKCNGNKNGKFASNMEGFRQQT